MFGNKNVRITNGTLSSVAGKRVYTYFKKLDLKFCSSCP